MAGGLALIMDTPSTSLKMASTKAWTPDEIRALRKRLNLTQTELAERLGYERRQTVTDLERGEYMPSGPVRRLLDLLDVEAQHEK